MLSGRLIHMVEANSDQIISRVLQQFREDPAMIHLRSLPETELREWAQNILYRLGYWLAARNEEELAKQHEALGRVWFEQFVPLHEVVRGLSVLKDKMIGFVQEQGLAKTWLQLYAEGELEQRVSRFFDVLAVRLVRGYESAWREVEQDGKGGAEQTKAEQHLFSVVAEGVSACPTLKRKLIGWLESRTGLESAIKNFFYEDIPASSGWPQVFGSVALFLFLLQAFTGILLSLNYAPTAGEAYNSVKYIVTELTGGRIIRGLHHWGASMMIVVVILHMTQVFLYGAYKKPREATWMVGVVLLLLTLGFGVTGYLLPWDNRAYWGTVVVTQIASKVPLAGPYLSQFLDSGSNVGVVAFARFYSAHVLLLPVLTMFLIGLHVYLVRKHGVAPAPGDTGPRKKFFPEQVLKDTVAIFAAFAILLVTAVLVRVPLGRLADPTDATYIPRPEWYFLFLFETLKFFEGHLEVVGSCVLPTLAVLALFAIPFFDRRQVMKLSQRTAAFGAVGMAAFAWMGLTVAAIMTTPGTSALAAGELAGPAEWQRLSPEELAGIGYFRKERCASCHTQGEGAAKIGPDLVYGVRKSAAWMIQHFKHPAQVVPGSSMPPIQLNDSQLNSLAALLLKLNPHNAKALESAPDWAIEGALLYQANRCGSCHMVNGAGAKLGPPLNGLSRRRNNDWIERHFRDPQVLSPGSPMPAYRFSPRQMNQIVSYVLSIPDED